MRTKRYKVDIVLREVVSGRSRRIHSWPVLDTASEAAARHITAQVRDGNWNAAQELAYAFSTFPEADRRTLQQEGFGP